MSESLQFASWAELKKWLEQDLGYCGCSAYEDAVELLRDVLRIVRDRTDSTSDAEAFRRASEALEARLRFDDVPGLATWFLYSLDLHRLVWHGFRATDCWLTDKGRSLLAALEQHWPPPEPPDES